MRVYVGTTADEVQEFLNELTLDLPDVYAPTEIFRSTHPEMDEEEIEYSLSLLAAEDALELVADGSGAPLVIAFEVAIELLSDFDEISAVPNAPLHWKSVEAVFTVGDDVEDLTWFAPQEVPSHIQEWLQG
jgi:glyoxylate carboligase